MVGLEKGGERGCFQGKMFRRKKLDPKKPKEFASKTEGVKLRPGYLHYRNKQQPDTKAREARSQPG